jgi:hypothetical protein
VIIIPKTSLAEEPKPKDLQNSPPEIQAQAPEVLYIKILAYPRFKL